MNDHSSAFSFLLSGPLVHHLYAFMEKHMPREKKYSSIKRLLFDRLIFAPPFLLLFLYYVAIVEVSVHLMAATIIISETNILALVIATRSTVKYLLQAVTTIKFLLPLLSSQNVIVASDISTNLVLAVLSSQVH